MVKNLILAISFGFKLKQDRRHRLRSIQTFYTAIIIVIVIVIIIIIMVMIVIIIILVTNKIFQLEITQQYVLFSAAL